MTTIICTLLIVYLGWYLVKPLVGRLIVWWLKRKMSRAFGDAFSGGGTPYGSRRASDRPGPAPRQARKGKIFGRDEGEYVEFEDIAVSSAECQAHGNDFGHDPRQSSAAHGAKHGPYTPREPQVSDAEWVDID